MSVAGKAGWGQSTLKPEVVEMAIERMSVRFEEEEKPIVVRFERLLRKLLQLEVEIAETMAKNLEVLGRGGES